MEQILRLRNGLQMKNLSVILAYMKIQLLIRLNVYSI